MNWSNLSL